MGVRDMLRDFLERAAADQSVYITDVRKAFQAGGTRPFHLCVTLYDRSVRVFDLLLPETAGEDEAQFVAEYVYANVYNLLSALGGRRVDVCLDRCDREAVELAERLGQVFQLDRAKGARTGYGKCLNVNERVLSVLPDTEERFAFGVWNIGEVPAVQPRQGEWSRPSSPGCPP